MTIDNTGLATIDFTLADENGVALDLDGVFSEGAVQMRFVMAALDESGPASPLQYVAYTTNADNQAASDAGGTFTTVDIGAGQYTYQFGTTINVTNPALTHTVGAYAWRDVGETRYVSNELTNFRPDGQAVATTREVVKTDACNACHGQLALHGGTRQKVELCILCHQPQSIDPQSTNTVDFKVMVHKIHRGADLPSVLGGAPYQIVGYQGAVEDYSTVAFPQDMRNCDTCHTGAQGQNWNTLPSRAVCGSCHDRTSFDAAPPAGWTAHTGGAQANDNGCTVCHPSTGGLAGIQDMHKNPLLDVATKLELSIDGVTSTAPGQAPVVAFTVKYGGAPRDIIANPLTRLRANIAGPTTDYASRWTLNIQGTGATGTLAAVDAPNGKFQYIVAAASVIPVTATGSYAIGLEGYMQPDPLGPRFAAYNPVAYFPVTDAAAVPRREIVAEAACKSCHETVRLHGGARQNPNYCAFCHNAALNNLGTAASPGNGMPRPEDSVVRQATEFDFKRFIHRLHRGEELTNPFLIYSGVAVATPMGTTNNLGEVRFPGVLNDCQTCHLPGTNELPLAPGVLPTQTGTRVCIEDPALDADGYCQDAYVQITPATIPPTTSACTGCHDADYTKAHAEVMTTASGLESCATCHGSGKDFDVAVVHAK